MSSSHIKIHIPLKNVSAIGPGKANLLEAIAQSGSISAAARAMGMSYKRAWDLVSIMNQSFREPLVSTATGGSQGGGAVVTEFGLKVLKLYRGLEAKANKSVAREINELTALLQQER